eukprot:5019087-Karenia_brevis.AAC.1
MTLTSFCKILGKKVYQECDPSASGLDSWTYQEWQLLPVDAFTTPAFILNAGERGQPWPSPTLHTKSHPLNKDHTSPI